MPKTSRCWRPRCSTRWHSAWPVLQIVATVGDGLSAVQTALALRPGVLFFDIRMPGQSGLDAAAGLADAWPTIKVPFPALVFVTACDQYAVQAFEAQAMDYLLKPVHTALLQKTVQKLQKSLASQAPAATVFKNTIAQLRQLLATPGLPGSGAAASTTPLTVIAASQGAQVHMVPVSEVLYLEAADK